MPHLHLLQLMISPFDASSCGVDMKVITVVSKLFFVDVGKIIQTSLLSKLSLLNGPSASFGYFSCGE